MPDHTSDLDTCQACFGTGFHARMGPNIRCPYGCEVPSLFLDSDFDELGRLKAYHQGPQPRKCSFCNQLPCNCEPETISLREQVNELTDAATKVLQIIGDRFEEDQHISFTPEGLERLNAALALLRKATGGPF